MMSKTQSPQPYCLFVGLDRSDRSLEWTEVDPADRSFTRSGSLPNRPEAILEWMRALQARFPKGTIAMALEQPASTLEHVLSAFPHVDLFPLNPGAVASYRLSRRPSRAKSDAIDAEVIARFLSERHEELNAFKPDTVLTRKISGLVAARRSLVDLRTQLTNMLIASLKAYYPQALQLAGENLYAPLALAFLRKWPTMQALKKVRPTTVVDFYRKHRCVRTTALDRRLELIDQAVPLTDDAAILEVHQATTRALLAQIEPLQASIEKMEHELFEAFGEHPDAFIFESLPGAGRIHAARLLSAFGSRRERFPDSKSILQYSGIAPILFTTGNKAQPRTIRRRACPTFVKQSFHEWAGETIKHSFWAKAFYRQQRKEGKRHHTAVRALAYKWIRILHRLWTDKTRYDETFYLQRLKHTGSTLFPDIELLIQNAEKNPHSA